jgi:hypothetical protein
MALKGTKDPRTEVDSFVDRMGNVIKPGDTIVYANAIGRASKTAVGMVLKIYEAEGRWKSEVTNVTMRVVSIQGDMYDRAEAKEVTLTETDRVLRYSESLLTEDLLKMLVRGELKGPCKTCGHPKGKHWSTGTCWVGDAPCVHGCKKYEGS